MKNVLFILLILVSCKGFSQNTIEIKEVDQAFDLIFANPDEAIVALNTLEQQTKNQNDSLYGIVLNHKGVYYAVNSDLEKAIYYFDAATAHLKQNSEAKVNASKNKAVILKKQGKKMDAIALLNSTLIEANKHKHHSVAAAIYGELGSCYQSLERYQEALDFLIKSIALWEKYEPEAIKKIAVEKQKLANLYFKMNNSDYALSILSEIKPLFKEQNDFYNYYLIQITQANIYLHLQQPSKALNYLNEALQGIERFDNSELTLYAFERKAKAHELLKQNQQAILYYQKAIALGISAQQVRTVFSFIEFGNLLLKLNELKKLDALVAQSLQPNFKTLFILTNTEDQERFYTFLANYHKLQGNISEQQKYNQLSDAAKKVLDSKYNINIVREKQANYRVQLVEKEIGETKQNLLFEKNKTLILLLCSFLLIAIAVFLFFKSKAKAKKLTVNLKALTQINTNNQESFITEKKTIEERLLQIKQKEQELLSQTLEIVEAQMLANKADTENSSAANNEFTAKYWENVLHKFKSINTTYDSTLMTLYPQLTKGDREFCSFIKLNLSNKEIAILLQISHKSVITKKYRMVKKLNLNPDVDFYQWLNAIPYQ